MTWLERVPDFEARARRTAGRYRDADALLGPLVDDAVAVAYAPLTAEARIERALVGLELARKPAAAADLSLAAALAESVGADEIRLAAFTAWLRAVGEDGPAPLASRAARSLHAVRSCRASAAVSERATSHETCLAHQHGELSANLYDPARACIDRRRDEVEALLTVLAAPDVDVL